MFAVSKGKNNVLLSAPHVFNHYRRNLDSVVKQGEPWTDYIVRNIATSSNSSSIALEKTVDFDPNYDILSKNKYKQEVSKIVKSEKVKLFIDVHGLSDKYSYDFAIYYPLRYRKSESIAYDLAEILSKGPLRSSLVIVLNLKDNDQETLTEYVAQKHKIPAVQLEIARYIREDDSLREPMISAISNYLLKK